MNQLFTYFPYIVSKILEKTINYWNSLNCKKASNSDNTVRFLSGSKIINARKLPSSIKIGRDTTVRGELFLFAHDGCIEIGEDCYIGENTKIWSANKIKIGNQVLISHNVNIHDTNGHPINSQARHKHYREILKTGHPKDDIELSSSPITILDNAWICFNSVILKGVTIGEGAIIGAGSVVTKDVAPWTIVAGNPAKLIREIPENER